MKLIIIFSILAITSLVVGQSYHTISIDGINDFNQINEKISTTSGSNLSSFITWDKNFLYVGFEGSTPSGSLTDPNRVFHIYIDSDPQENPTSGNGTSVGEAWRWNPTLPFTANYHYVFKTIDNTEYKKVFNLTWNDAIFSTENFKAAGYWEVKISLNDLGNPDQLNLIAYIEEDWNAGSICGGMPDLLFTNTNTQGNIGFNSHFENFNLIDSIYPYATYNKDNYQFLLRLKGSVGTYKDTTTYLGMAVNASNGYDKNVDLPEPPSPPSNYINVYFKESAWGSQLGPNYSRNIKKLTSLNSTTSSWDFEVSTDQLSMVSLEADKFSSVPSNYEIKIYDISNNTTHDIRNNGAYSYTPLDTSPKSFRLIIGTTLTSPNISAGQDTLNFGSVKTNVDSILSLSISNTGDSTLSILNIISTNPAFTNTSNTSFTLESNNSINLSIKFSPSTAGSFSGQLKIVSNDPDTDTLSVVLLGKGLSLVPIISSSATSLDFGNIKVDYDSTIAIKIFNTGDTTLTVSNLLFSDNVFSTTSNSSFPVFVNDSVAISLNFKPLMVKNYSGTLKIVSDDPITDTLSVQMNGTGISSHVSNSFTNGWHLISIPLIPNDSRSSNIIGDNINQFQLFNYSSGGYLSADSMSIAKGYWLGLESTTTIDVDGTAAVDSVHSLLQGGWNLIANPFVREYLSSSIEFKKSGGQWLNSIAASDSGYIQNNIYGFNSTTGNYLTQDTLNRWEGYWLATLVTNLQIGFVHENGFGSPLNKLKFDKPNNDSWKVNIIAELDYSSDKMLFFGESSEGTNGFDSKLDLAKPPKSPTNAVYSYFNNPDFNDFINNYQSNISELSNSNNSWEFFVDTKKDGELQLSWPEIKKLNDERDFILTYNGKLIDMKQINSINISVKKDKTYKFNINAVPVGIDETKNVYNFMLNQNYPNPFNPTTSISFTLPKQDYVTLKIFDILGNELYTLVDGIKESGPHTVSFDASNLASGIYFYQIITNNNSGIKKMILMK